VKARQIIKLLHYLPQAEVLLDGYDDPLRGVIRAMDALPERQATQCMIGPLVASVSTTVSDIVAAAILGGHRRITVSVLAQICALPIRTLEWRLRACGAPEARRMLGWVLSLHVLWRLDMLRRTPKQVAAASGFRSAEAMSAFVGRQTGCRPRAVMASGGFERLLDACVQRWQHGDLTQRARAL